MLYAGEGESRKPDENATHPALAEQGEKDKVATIVMKGHEFVAISFHMPASCETCTKPLWAPFRPPPAVECRRECDKKSSSGHDAPPQAVGSSFTVTTQWARGRWWCPAKSATTPPPPRRCS